ncbi:Hypothetical predicted protein [Mytilus galloprovincialis]|uniref:Uncharacterized protein n=1 Tax=Mytilus galloprovincialis TaxID=29158 RepID=A0A8B6EYQ0_MYTGA|nr:Hypothetical predicted protein [Mytilus galloprovincialis]
MTNVFQSTINTIECVLFTARVGSYEKTHKTVKICCELGNISRGCWSLDNTSVDNIVMIKEAEVPEFEMADEDQIQNDILIDHAVDVYMCA